MSRRSVFLLTLTLLRAPPAFAAEQVVAAARAALPDQVRSSGVLRVATSLQWPPYDYATADAAPDGIDFRLMRLLAEKLGLCAEFTDVKFPSIVPGVDQINITTERAKIVDFVPYTKDGMGLLVRKGTTGLDVNHLCGRTLVLTQGSASDPGERAIHPAILHRALLRPRRR